MEELIKERINEYKIALKNFETSLQLKIFDFHNDVQDSIRSGRIQKFEFCTELMWKTIKLFINTKNGLDPAGPKMIIKAFMEAGYCSYEEYEVMMNILNDRNKLSHIYKEEMVEEIAKKLEDYKIIMDKVLKIIESTVGE